MKSNMVGAGELKWCRSSREAVGLSWQQSTKDAHTPNRSTKNLHVPKTAGRQTDGDGREASNGSPFLIAEACCCFWLLIISVRG